MKNTLSCPKCNGRKLWCIEQFSAKDPSVQVGGKLALRAAVSRRTPPMQQAGFWAGDGSDVYDAGYVDAFICAACGYTELWSRELQGLVHNPASGVHFIDASRPTSPMR